MKHLNSENLTPEGDLYRLIIRSKLPAAVRFEAFVFDEVLPSIRKHGAYITSETLEKVLADPDMAMKYFAMLKAEREQKDALDECVQLLTPKADYYDVILRCGSPIPVTVIAKDYAMTACALNKKLNELGVQFKVRKTWVLKKQYSGKGYTVSQTYSVDETQSVIHTYWTQKGRQFVYELLKSHGILPAIERGGS